MKTTATAIKSQLETMSGKTVTSAAPQSKLAMFVHAELKGGEAKRNFVMSIISSAIVQALKGNSRDIPEAIKFCAGKAKKARAFMAGFQAIANDLSPVKYEGKFDAATNAAARAEVVARSASLEFDFKAAYLSVMDEKPEPKAPKAKSATEGDATAEGDATTTTAAPVATINAERAVVDVAAAVDAVAAAMSSGLLDAAELQIIRMALMAHDEAIAAAATSTALETAAA